jgi:hypothetical protein
MTGGGAKLATDNWLARCFSERDWHLICIGENDNMRTVIHLKVPNLI